MSDTIDEVKTLDGETVAKIGRHSRQGSKAGSTHSHETDRSSIEIVEKVATPVSPVVSQSLDMESVVLGSLSEISIIPKDVAPVEKKIEEPIVKRDQQSTIFVF